MIMLPTARTLVLLGCLTVLAACNEQESAATPPNLDVAWSLPQKRGVTPVLVAKSEPVVATTKRLERVVVRYARDPLNPWAVCHAILALGPDIKLTNNEPAIDYLFAEYGEEREVEGNTLVGFPQRTRRTKRNGKEVDVLVEAHPELILKALVERGVRPDREVTVAGKPHTVGDLYRHCMWSTWSRGGLVAQQHWSNMSWGMRAIVTWAPDELAWTARGGKAMTLNGYVHESVQDLLASTAPRREEMKTGTPPPKDHKGLDSYTCGGAHSVDATGYALGRGFGSDGDRSSYDAVMRMWFWYYPRRLDYLTKLLADQPKYKGIIRTQQLKFIGHFVELTHKMAAVGVLVPDEQQQAMMRRAVNDLVAICDTLHNEGVFENMEAIRKANEQAYLDFVGDSAHALYGLQIATGDLKIPY